MPNDDVLSSHPLPQPRKAGALVDELILKAAARILGDIAHGRLRLTLPSGRTASIGNGEGGVDASIDVKSLMLFWRAMRRATLGVGESYMRGEFDTPDLGNLFRFYLANQPNLAKSRRPLVRGNVADWVAHRLRSNTRSGSRRNIAAHYDLGNAFYAAWLDEGMTYSSALYREGGLSLEAAQQAKIAAVMEALDVPADASVLEIGCGWGALAEAMARHGARVTGITLSDAQLRFARARLSQAGLSERTEIRFQDYRDTGGTFDRVVSIEMIEAVGEDHWPAYFGAIHDRLAPGGSAVIQAITISDASYAGYRRTPDFIQAYIFPGGMLPTVSAMQAHAEAANLTFDSVLTFGDSYVQTLREWRNRFERAWPSIAAMGFDERFRRMWLYYLIYCEVGFEDGCIDVGLYRLRKSSAITS